jgi:hypothetical protein
MTDAFQFVKPHLLKPHVEIEFRLGKKNGNLFDTNIGKSNYDKLFRRLSRYHAWDQVKKQNAVVYYGLRKGLRIVYDEDTDDQTVVYKHKLDTLDIPLEGLPVDVRIGVALETPATYDTEKDKFPTEKKRQRVSFIRKGLSIDLSIIQNMDRDSEEEFVYQLELEILKPETCDEIKFTNHFHKVFDVLKLIEC